MKQMHWRQIAVFLILGATIGPIGAAQACQRAAKAAWMANASQTRIAARDDAACSGSVRPGADEAGVIRPQQKSPGGTHR